MLVGFKYHDGSPQICDEQVASPDPALKKEDIEKGKRLRT